MEEKSPVVTIEESASTSEVHRLVSRLKEAVQKKPESSSVYQHETHDIQSDTHSSKYPYSENSVTQAQSSIPPHQDKTSQPSSSNEISSLKQIIKALAEKLKNAQETIETLQKQSPAGSNEHSNLLKEKENEIFFLRNSIKQLEQRLEIEKATSIEKEKKIAEEKTLLGEEQKKKIIELEKRAKEKEDLIRSLEQKLSLQPRNAELQSQANIESLHLEIARLRQQIKDQESKLLTKNLSPSLSQNHRPTSQEPVAKMALTMKALEEEVNSSRCERVALKREISHLSERLKKEEEKARQTESQSKDLFKELDELKRETQETQKLLEAEKQLRLDLERSLGQKEASLSDNIQEGMRLSQEKISLEEELSILKEAHLKLKGEHAALQELSQAKERENQALSEENYSLSQRLVEVEELLRDKIEQSLLLEEEIESVRSENIRLSEDIKALFQAKDESEFELARVKEENEEIRKHKDELEKELLNLKSACSEMRSSLMDAEMLFSISLQAQDLIRKGSDLLQRAHSKISKKSNEEDSQEISRRKAQLIEDEKRDTVRNHDGYITSYEANSGWNQAQGKERIDLESENLFKSSSEGLLFGQKRKNEPFQFGSQYDDLSSPKSTNDLF